MSERTRRACFYPFNLLLCVCFMAKGRKHPQEILKKRERYMSALTISEASILRYASAETLDVSKVFLVPLLNSILVEFFFKEFLD